jgi:hypothetical protein
MTATQKQDLESDLSAERTSDALRSARELARLVANTSSSPSIAAEASRVLAKIDAALAASENQHSKAAIYQQRYRKLAIRFKYDHIGRGQNGYHYDRDAIPGDDMSISEAVDALPPVSDQQAEHHELD